MGSIRRSNIDIRAIPQVVCADPAIAGQIVRRFRALSREREYRRHYNCYRNLHFDVSMRCAAHPEWIQNLTPCEKLLQATKFDSN
jgi:hypothetical protein